MLALKKKGKMKFRNLEFVAVIVTCLVAQSAICQSNANGLTVNAEASFLADAKAPQLFLTIHLLNTTNHEIVVLTKNLNVSFDLGGDTNILDCSLGYNDPAVTYQGHLVIPPVSDLAPVTIKPNEEAFFTQLIEHGRILKRITKKTQLKIHYAISPEWGSRFGTWSGSATSSKPCDVSIKYSP
jgi:hypothetical protein